MVVERAVRIDLASVLPAVVSGFWIRYQLAFVFPCAGRRFPGSHYSGFRGLPRPVVLQRSSHILNVVVGFFIFLVFIYLFVFLCRLQSEVLRIVTRFVLRWLGETCRV